MPQRTSALTWVALTSRAAFATCIGVVQHQRSAIEQDIAQLRRLPSMVARATIGESWTREDRRQAAEVARSLMRVGVWCVIVVMPGGLLLLPLVSGNLPRR
jgi:hypothetical protein